jgi:hypothetical protein
MHRLTASLFLLLLLSRPVGAGSAPAENRVRLSGVVRDAATGDTVSAANVRVLGTTLGTVTNRSGSYILALFPGRYRVVFSSLGYSPDTVTVELIRDMVRDVMLTPSEIVLAEILVTGEDPAREIIRRAIANKRRWMERLHSYELDAFTRQTIMRDTAIASISESFTKGYWRQGDTLREIVRQKRQTENIKSQFNFAAVGRILNFYEDRLRFAGYEFVGPVSQDAFDYYDYKLFETRHSRDGDVYTIRVLPQRRTSPLFTGTVSIVEGPYALVGVEVEPNEAFLFPFLKEKSIRYRQQFALYDDVYWMPVDITIDASFTVGVVGFSFPRIGFRQTSAIYSYDINTPIPDSVFRGSRLTVDSVALERDTLLWKEIQVIPLSPPEQAAYAALDSTKTLEVQFRPGGVAATIGSDAGILGSLVEFVDFTFNRVEGFHLGASAGPRNLLPVLGVKGTLAYGFSEGVVKYSAGAVLYTSPSRSLGFGGELFRRTENSPDRDIYSPLITAFGCLLAKDDYRDYFRTEGWEASVRLRSAEHISAELTYHASRDLSDSVRTRFSLFYPSRVYRANPAVRDGSMRSVQFHSRLGREPVPLELEARDALDVSIEYARPGVTGGDFDFLRYDIAASLQMTTFARSFFFKPNLRLRLAAGTSSGSLPPQRAFALESSMSALGPFGVLRTAGVKEFRGTGYFCLAAEHNFRTLPFLALGIPFLYEKNIELVLGGAIARVWERGSSVRGGTNGWCAEAGVGLARIFDFFRVDATWRLTGPNKFVVTIGTASFL